MLAFLIATAYIDGGPAIVALPELRMGSVKSEYLSARVSIELDFTAVYIKIILPVEAAP